MLKPYLGNEIGRANEEWEGESMSISFNQPVAKRTSLDIALRNRMEFFQ
jgi:hypothetical protein